MIPRFKKTENKYNKTDIIAKKEIKSNLLFLSFSSLILIVAVIFFPVSASAATLPQQSFSISPIIINVPLQPGKTYSYDITLQNLTTLPLPLKTNLNDFQTTGEEGGYIFEDSRTNPLLSWITVRENQVILSPHEKKKIVVTIATPKQIPFGGYYGMLFFEVVPQNTDQTQILSKVGVLLLATIGAPDPNEKQASILTFSTGLLHENNQIPLVLRVQNTSLCFFTAHPILTISPLISLHSKETKAIYLEDKIIFQNKVRRWEQAISLPSNQPNIYKAHLAVSTGEGKYAMQDSYFIVFPFTPAILIVAMCAIFLFLIIKRKRLRKALNAFLGG